MACSKAVKGLPTVLYLVRNYFLGLVQRNYVHVHVHLPSRQDAQRNSYCMNERATTRGADGRTRERASHHTGGGRTHARARPTSLGGRPDARLSAAAGDPRGGVSPPGSPSRADRESARADFPRMHARFLWGSAAASGALVVASGSDSRAWRATIRRWERSSRTPSRTLVEMSSSAKAEATNHLPSRRSRCCSTSRTRRPYLAEAGLEASSTLIGAEM